MNQKHSNLGEERPSEIEQEISGSENDNAIMNINNIQSNTRTYISFCSSLLRVLNLCFSSFYFGYILAYLGTFSFDTIVKIYGIENDQDTVQGLLQGIVAIGGGVGALSASVVMRKFSRRNSLLFINSVALTANVFVWFPNLYIFFAARFFQGICVGLNSALIPMLIKQYSPNELSGTFGALNQAFVAFGVFFVYLFQLVLKSSSEELEHWRIIYMFPILTTLTQTLVLLLIYKQQTPKYYLMQGDVQNCIQYLRLVYRQEYVDRVLNEKRADIGMLTNQNKNSNLEQMEEVVNDQEDKHGKKLRIITAIHLALLQQFVGINSVIAYGVQIVAKAMPSLSNLIPVILNLEGVVASFIASLLLAKLGRRIILQAGTFVSALSILAVGIGFMIKSSNEPLSNAFVIIGLVIFMANFGLSLGPVVWLYIAEIVEPQIIPYSTLVNWTATTIVIITFPILTRVFGSPVPLFFFFAVWSSLSLFVNKKLLIETKGKTEKQIKDQYCQK